MTRDGDPPRLDTKEVDRPSYLRGIFEANPDLPTFPLTKYPDSYGSALGIEDFLESALDRAQGRIQVIANIGLLGSGKSITFEREVDYLRKRIAELGLEIPVYLLTSEEALTAARDVKTGTKDVMKVKSLKGSNVAHKSGEYTKRDYQESAFVLRRGIKKAMEDARDNFGGRGIVLIETPATAGYIVGEDRERLGSDRGTSALRLLSTGEEYEGLDYDFAVAAVVSEPNLYIENILSRIRKKGGEPGGTVEGTIVANRELDQVLRRLLKRIDPNHPYLRGSEIYQVITEKLEVLGNYFFPWALRDYFNLPRDRAIVLENHRDPEVQPAKKFEGFITSLPFETKIELAFQPQKNNFEPGKKRRR